MHECFKLQYHWNLPSWNVVSAWQGEVCSCRSCPSLPLWHLLQQVPAGGLASLHTSKAPSDYRHLTGLRELLAWLFTWCLCLWMKLSSSHMGCRNRKKRERSYQRAKLLWPKVNYSQFPYRSIHYHTGIMPHPWFICNVYSKIVKLLFSCWLLPWLVLWWKQVAVNIFPTSEQV